MRPEPIFGLGVAAYQGISISAAPEIQLESNQDSKLGKIYKPVN
jgi:hypothetical protein